MVKEKTAIIMLGGGMRSAHGAGFLYAMATKLNITSPSIIIASSGDAGTALYYSAAQYESIKRIWCELLSTPQFISYLRPWRIMDIDYLIDVIFKKLERLDTAKLFASPIDWFISATNFATGAARYVGKTDSPDPFEVLRASKALPVFYGKRISLFGKKYFDGELGPTLADHVAKARAEGARRILILNHNGSHTSLSKLVVEAYGLTVGKELREALIRDVSDTTTCVIIPDVPVLCVVPKDLAVGKTTRNKKKLQETFDRGVLDALTMKDELHALFSMGEPHRTQESAARLRNPQRV